MSGKGERAIRFAAGVPDGPHGTVYRLWAVDGSVRPDGPSDVYLADRSMGGILKTSLHASGQWRTAFTEYAVTSGKVTLPAGVDRKVTAWERPAMVAKGFTIAYWVATPSSELRTTRTSYVGQPIHWVPDPGPGLAVHFVVVLVPAVVTNLTLSDQGSHDERLLEHFRLPNGEIVGVISRVTPLSEAAVEKIRAAVGGFTVHAVDGGPPDPMDRVRSTLFVETDEGGEALIDVAIPCTV